MLSNTRMLSSAPTKVVAIGPRQQGAAVEQLHFPTAGAAVRAAVPSCREAVAAAAWTAVPAALPSCRGDAETAGTAVRSSCSCILTAAAPELQLQLQQHAEPETSYPVLKRRMQCLLKNFVVARNDRGIDIWLTSLMQ